MDRTSFVQIEKGIAMKNVKIPALFVAAALYAVPVFAQQRDTGARAGEANDTARAQTASERQGAAGAQGQQGQMSEDQAFVRGAASGGMFEVQAAKLALQKAQRPEVKEFAQKIIDDHTKANQRLMQIAQSKQIQVPREMKAADRGELQDLGELNGQQFEDAFVIGQTGDHVKMILKFKNCEQKLQDPQLKQFAQEQLPHLQQHLQQAQQLSGWDAAQTAGAHIRGSSDANSSQHERGDRGATPAAGERNTSGSRSGSATGNDAGSGAGNNRSDRDASK